MLNTIANAVLRPFGLALFLDPSPWPRPGRPWFEYERQHDVPGGPATMVWFGHRHAIIDRGER